MIYKKKLKKRLPKKRLLELFELTAPNYKYRWDQFCDNDTKIITIIAELLGISPNKIDNCVMHVLSADVDPHRDSMSTGVYLIPIIFTKSIEFYDEDISLHFESGCAYKFNDYIAHGISNPYYAHTILLSVDTNNKWARSRS
jgi:hypothetical protein